MSPHYPGYEARINARGGTSSSRPTVRGSRALVLRLPLLIRDAVDRLALSSLLTATPWRRPLPSSSWTAVPGEAGQIHQIDVLDVRFALQMVDHAGKQPLPVPFWFLSSIVMALGPASDGAEHY